MDDLLPPITKDSLAWQGPPKRKPRARKPRKQPARKRYTEGPAVHRNPQPQPEFELHGGHLLAIFVVLAFLASTIWW